MRYFCNPYCVPLACPCHTQAVSSQTACQLALQALVKHAYAVELLSF
jgi:hypothetical protein